MKSFFWLFFSILYAISVSFSWAASVQGTRVTLAPPEGFEVSDRFPGFILKEHNASIMVTEMPGPYEPIISGFSMPEELQKQQMQKISEEILPERALPAKLIHLKQEAYETTWLKWILIMGNETGTLIVTATFLKQDEALFSAVMKEAVLSTQWNVNETKNLFDGLDFRISHINSFEVKERMGHNILLKSSKEIPDATHYPAFFVIGLSFSEQLFIQDLTVFAKKRLFQTEQVKDLWIEQEKEITLDGLKGIELIATGKHVKFPHILTLYQVVLLDKAGYVLMQGIMEEKEKNQRLSLFQKVAYSFKQPSK